MHGDKAIWSVGGVGGSGKTMATANLGCALALRGAAVVVVDADRSPEGAGLHSYFGIKSPDKRLGDFIKGRVTAIEDVMVPTGIKWLSLISGASELVSAASPAHPLKQKLLTQLKNIEADYILVDLGAGATYGALDFFALSSVPLVVLVPAPVAVQTAYTFLKSFVYRRLQRMFAEDPHITGMITQATDLRSLGSVKTFSDLCERISRADVGSAERALAEIKSFRPRLLLNLATGPQDLKVIDTFQGAAGAFLGLETEFVGAINSSPALAASASAMRPFVLDEDAKDSREELIFIVERLVSGVTVPEQAQPEGECEVYGYNDNVSHIGTVFHVQTEVQGGSAPSVETVVYNGGRIFFSKRTLWNEMSGTMPGVSLKDFSQRQHKAAMAAIKLNKITLQG